MNDPKDLEGRLRMIGEAIRAKESIVDAVMERVAEKPVPRAPRRWTRWIRTWVSVLPRVALVGAAAAALLFFWGHFEARDLRASQVLARAAVALARIDSVALKVKMRTLPRDNFEVIGLDFDFVPIDLCKSFAGATAGQWRIEKPGRVVVMDGEKSLLLIKPRTGARGGIDSGFVVLLRHLLDVHRVIDEASRLASEEGVRSQMAMEPEADGTESLVVTLEVPARGDFTNPWLKNRFVSAADTRRVYRFDRNSLVLKGLEIFVRTERGDVLVLATTDIRFNEPLGEPLFAIDFPADTVWYEQPKTEADERYAKLSPAEMAEAFFGACARGDRAEAIVYFSRLKDEDIWAGFRGLEVLSIGEPFQSGLYAGWFVPYRIRYRSGRVKEHNLAVRNDHPGRYFVVDGGL